MPGEAALQEQEIVPGTEGTEYEGMDEEAIEKAEFAKALNDDDDIDGTVEVELEQKEPEQAPEVEDPPEKPAVEEAAVAEEEKPEPGEEKPEPTEKYLHLKMRL